MRKTDIIIRGYHCDAYGHVNNARYLEFLEAARWDFLQPAIEEKFFNDLGLLFVVVNLNINYRKPLVPNMKVEVNVSAINYYNSKIMFRQEIVNKEDGVLCCDAEVTFVLLDKNTNKPTPVIEQIKTKFDELLIA